MAPEPARIVIIGAVLCTFVFGGTPLLLGPFAAAPQEFLVSGGILRDEAARFVVLGEPSISNRAIARRRGGRTSTSSRPK